MNKNIKQNYFLQVKKILDKADKAGDLANHFRGIAIIGDKNRSECYYWSHAPKEDLEKMLLHAIREDDVFAYSVAKALETRLTEIEQTVTKNNNNNEENHSKEA